MTESSRMILIFNTYKLPMQSHSGTVSPPASGFILLLDFHYAIDGYLS